MSKNIILCSDGTGQKGNYGADSNVYKLYQMVNLHNTEKEKEQITFYDNGVGTSDSDTDSKTNAIWRAMSSAFGFGFQENVCDLYHFLARNYEVGDQIYFFGFSRGAATVRACVGFINHCGLLNKNHANLDTDEAFEERIKDAIESYHQWQKNNKAAEFKEKWAVKDDTHAPDGNLKIHFVGVWDTVSALGFPKDVPFFSKLFEKLDEHESSFYDFELNENVEYAYHALSIDDARQTFHPLVWDESRGNVVEQVWFAGVHSNVGGGYPRTELSDVAFDWMLERAAHHGLQFVGDERESIKAHANPHGKLYDSRDGFGVYYRYQPRDLAKLCAEYNKPAIRVKIHESAIERMKHQTAKYAPSYIPAEFDIVSTDLDAKGKSVNLPNDIKDEKAADEWQKQWKAVSEEVNVQVKKRTFLYNTFMQMSLLSILTALLLWMLPSMFPAMFPSLLPYVAEACKACAIKAGFPWQLIYDAVTYVTPAMFDNFFTYVIRIYPIVFIVLIGITIFMWLRRKSILNDLQKALEKFRALLVSNL